MKTKDRRFVNGIEGLADYVLEHIEDIENGEKVVFLPDGMENTTGLSLDEVKAAGEEWCCVHALGEESTLESSETVLYMDYFGGRNPQVIIVIEKDILAESLQKMLVYEDLDRWFYVETVDYPEAS